MVWYVKVNNSYCPIKSWGLFLGLDDSISCLIIMYYLNDECIHIQIEQGVSVKDVQSTLKRTIYLECDLFHEVSALHHF